MWLLLTGTLCYFVVLLDRGLCFDIAAIQSELSSGATIAFGASSAPRWSEFQAPMPGVVINVATEEDVQLTARTASVKYCIQNNISFLAQNGGNGWASTFTLKQNGIIINLAGLRKVTFNSARTQVTLQGGALISNVVSAAAANSALVPTGTCNCVGTLGAILGGGLGNLMGLYGLGVDNLKSLNVVTPDGKAITVTPKDTDLWWALRGAGPNFGIVTSAVMNSYPVSASGLQAWLGPLIFTSNKLEAVIQAINNLTLTPEMALSMTWVNSNSTPTIIVSVFYYGTANAGKAAFASLYAAGPVADRTAITPYTAWNNAADVACTKGGRKPDFGVGLSRIDPDTWRAVSDKYAELVKLPGAGNSTVLLNAYATAKERSVADCTASYPFRKTVKFFATFSPFYTDRGFDATAVDYGAQVRDLWRKTSGLERDSTYINNAFGDENLSTVYGVSLDRLKAIKKKIDPQRRFNQWFPLS